MGKSATAKTKTIYQDFCSYENIVVFQKKKCFVLKNLEM